MFVRRQLFVFATLLFAPLLLPGLAAAQDCQSEDPPPPPECYSASVTPHGGTVTWPANTGGHIAIFTIQNTGVLADIYNVSCGGSGSVTCTDADVSWVQLQPGQTQQVTVTYAVGSGGGGTIYLTASGIGGDAGWLDVQLSAGVAVTPDGQTSVPRGKQTAGHSETFTVHNLGSTSNTFNLTCGGTDGVTCAGAPTPASATLAGDSSTTVTAAYSVGAPETGRLTLTATSTGAPVVSDTGSYNVPILARAVAVRAELPERQHFAASTGSHRFFVKNLEDISATFTLTVACSGTASGCAVSPTSLTLTPGESKVATLSYTIGAGGTTGSGLVRAVDVLSSTLRDSASVALKAIAPPFPLVSVVDINPGTTVERDLCLTIAAGTGAAFEYGDLRIVHTLPVIRTLNKERAPTLLYNSAFADPYPIVAASVTLPNGWPLPDSVQAVLKVGGTEKARGRWAGSDWTAGATRRIALGYSAFADTTKVYDYTLEVAALSDSLNATSVTGKLVVVNRRGGGFGAGWWLAGLERLELLPDSNRLWVGGDGSARLYTAAGTDVWVAADLDRPDTLRRAGSAYLRRLPGGVRVWFNSAGQHDSTVNRLGHRTSFAYTGGRLASITLPSQGGGQTYSFSYDGNGQLSGVTAPGSRVTTVWVSAQRVDSIRDPGNGIVRFTYEDASSRRIVTRRDRRQAVTTYGYDAAKKLWRMHVNLGTDSIRVGFRARDVQGLATATPKTAVDTAAVYTSLFGARHFATGSNYVAQETKFWLDRYGAPRRIVNPLNEETVVRREDGQWPALGTELQAPNEFLTRAGYNARGNIVRTTAVNPLGTGQDAVARYHWDPTWDFADSTIMPTGVTTTMAYDPGNGNRLWQQVGSDPARRVTFRYGNTLGLLSSTVLPGTAADSLEYDGLGNLAASRTSKGFWASFYKDGTGRDTLVVSAVDSLDTGHGGTNTGRLRQRTVYDVMDRDTLVQTTGPAMSGTVEQTVIVRKSFDAEGNLLSLTRQSSPDPGGIGAITTAWRYDSAGRKRVEVAPDGRVDSTLFDPSGNAVAVRARRDSTITMRYDALNRLVERVVPAVSYPTRTEGIATFTGRTPLNRPYPYYPDGAAIPRDSATFAYNPAGAIARADNGDAWVRRDYYPNGLLRAETLYVRTLAALDVGGSMTQHKYITTHRYDVGGRRVVLKYPVQLAPASKDSVRFAYDAQTGALAQVWDLLGNTFRYHRNLRGEMDTLYLPGSISDSRAYDADGKVVTHLVSGGLRNTAFRYDARSKVLSTRNAWGSQDTLGVTYSGLGHLVTSQLISHFINQLGCTVRTVTTDTARGDALANLNYRSHRASLSSSQCSASSSTFGPRTEGSQPGTGRWAYAVYDGGLTKDTARYDAAGNTEFAWQAGYSSLTGRLEDRASYYALDGTLRAADYRTMDSPALDEAPIRFVFEEYRYDALGRRVWVRARRDCDRFDAFPNGGTLQEECRWDLVRRTVWDGSQELAEIQMPGGDFDPVENDTTTLQLGAPNGFDPNPFVGRVLYTYGTGVDQPLSLTRLGYADGSIVPWVSWAPFSIVPRWSMLGQADGGAFGAGATQCLPNAPQRCVKLVWPFAWNPYARQQLFIDYWHGTLTEDKRDKAATLYRRSRVYDPNTGRFTQEDPIGLAGGLNVYGFANGDPANYSDPFGLAGCPWHDIACLEDQVWASIGGKSYAGDVAAQFVTNMFVLLGASSVDEHAKSAAGGDRFAAVFLVGEILINAVPGGSEGKAGAAELGRLGERAVGRALNLLKNTKQIDGRIPDFINAAAREIIEVKNVAYQALTRQIRDLLRIADRTPGYRLVLYVRDLNSLSGPLRELWELGRIEVRVIPF